MCRAERSGMSIARGGLIAAVSPDGIGLEVGLEPGDRLVAINDHVLRDVIDYQFYGADEELVLEVVREGQHHRLEIERDYDEDLGLAFAEPVFDGMRQCINRCPFCFVQQMPRGLRRSLYLHDDDYRYSFLLGSFVTLTNLEPEDWARIGEQRLSPLYISVHATALDARRRLLGNPGAEEIVGQLRRLGDMGIQVHAQIVIVPGVNDGPVLRQTIDDLRALWPTVQTLALVPVGLTRFHREQARPLLPSEATAVLDLAGEVADELRSRLGVTWLYPSDELYLLANRPVPPTAFYDSDAQWENGVGLVRDLLDDWESCRGHLERSRTVLPRRVTLVCGTLIAPLLARVADDLAALTGLGMAVVPVENHLFGQSVTVSGLLAGRDVLDALAGVALGERVFLPRAMFDAAGERTLDDLTLDDLTERLGVPISPVSTMGQVVEALAQ